MKDRDSQSEADVDYGQVDGATHHNLDFGFENYLTSNLNGMLAKFYFLHFAWIFEAIGNTSDELQGLLSVDMTW